MSHNRIRLSLVITCLTVCRLAAQDRAPGLFELNQLRQQDTLLSGWIFHAGDDRQWAQPALNDKNWQPVDPGTDINQFDLLKKAGTGWLRLHIKTGSIGNITLAAWVNQFTASEIYLDGRLIKRYGRVRSGNIKAVSPGNELFVLPLQPGKEQVIAVRLGYQKGIPYIAPNFMPIPAFSLYVNSYPAAAVNYGAYKDSIKQLIMMYMLILGIFVFTTVIHLVYYLQYRQQKVHLYYFFYGFFISVLTASAIPFFDNIDDVALQMSNDILGTFAYIAGNIFAVLAIYEIFGYQRRTYFKVLIVFAVCLFATVFAGGPLGFFAGSYVFIVLAMLEGVRVCIWGLRQKKHEAVVFLPVLLLNIFFNCWSSVLQQTSLVSQLVSAFSYVCLPAGMAIYLGIQNALQNRRLSASLQDVQVLSAQKEQILADQNTILEHQVTERTTALNRSLTELKQTQNQLIQSAKMASLGELTAGIAHEIQNPLNFVNNFSEVSRELLTEMKEELAAGNLQDVADIATGLDQNLEKINHHGRRADSIVKGMLEHSHTSTGQKEPADLNKLADEYLRLSYHGLRAKNKSFNCQLVTHFDANLPQISVITQDIGRVLLNLFNNAFYATQQKTRLSDPPTADYKPRVEVRTRKLANKTEIVVTDNGIGIPQKILDKIYQPFFTTKPAGEGTGLGLSLSYDIIIKGHGGEIMVKSQENEFTEFIISLPL